MWTHKKDWNTIRPYYSQEEMHEALVHNHNEVVGSHDVTYHIGDFSLGPVDRTLEIISRLNGAHVFLEGSHDATMMRLSKSGDINSVGRLHVIRIGTQKIVLSHWAMRTWPYSHYGSWLAYGHSHCRLDNKVKCNVCGAELNMYPRSYDVGVDCNQYYPVSYDELQSKIMSQEELSI